MKELGVRIQEPEGQGLVKRWALANGHASRVISNQCPQIKRLGRTDY